MKAEAKQALFINWLAFPMKHDADSFQAYRADRALLF